MSSLNPSSNPDLSIVFISTGGRARGGRESRLRDPKPYLGGEFDFQA